MKRALVRAGLALAMAVSAASGWATAPDLISKQQQDSVIGDIVLQRKDVDEGSRPPPPTGPASQNGVCNPSLPDC